MTSTRHSDPDSGSDSDPAAAAATGNAPLGTRQRRKHRVRQEIVAAALELFRKKGFEATTVADIVDAVAMSPRTFHRYFKSKDDLAFDWLERQGEIMDPLVEARPSSESPLEAMEAAFLQLAGHHDAHRAQAVRLNRLIFDTPSLGGRFHDEAAKWEGRWVRILIRTRPHDPEHLFVLRVQVAIAITAFVVAVREWIAERDAGVPLRALVLQAFTAFEAADPRAPGKAGEPKRR